MDREERIFLRKAIKVQQTKEYGFWLEDDSIKTTLNIESSNKQPKKILTEDVKLSVLSEDFLTEEGLIGKQKVLAPMYYVTDRGWNYFRDRKKAFLQAIVKSVLAPVIVSLITTIVTLWLNGFLA